MRIQMKYFYVMVLVISFSLYLLFESLLSQLEFSSIFKSTYSLGHSIFNSKSSFVNQFNREQIQNMIGSKILLNQKPNQIEISKNGLNHVYNLHWSLDEDLSDHVEKMFSDYKPDFGAFVALDAKTGRILSMNSYTRYKEESDSTLNGNLAVQSRFPAASIFKIVTAGAAIDLKKAEPDTVVPFNGALHTLYRRNVQETRENRWTRYMTLKAAFGRSVNVFFGKLGLFYIGGNDLLHYAERFAFNRKINSDFPIEVGKASISQDDAWSVVTAASGFTRDNTMSPVQGAMMAAAIANDGVMMEPFLIQRITDEKGQSVYSAESIAALPVIRPESAEKVRELMQETVRSGTSRRSFRRLSRRLAQQVFDGAEVGGKTGSLMGLDPKGKCDWFVGYLRYKQERIAVAVLTVNMDKWRVKSSYVAGEFLKTYLKDLKVAEALRQRADENPADVNIDLRIDNKRNTPEVAFSEDFDDE